MAFSAASLDIVSQAVSDLQQLVKARQQSKLSIADVPLIPLSAATIQQAKEDAKTLANSLIATVKTEAAGWGPIP